MKKTPERSRLSAGQRSLLTNAGYGVASKVLFIALRLVYVLVLARVLGAAEYGLYVYALSWYMLFMPFSNLGQDLVLSRAIGGRSPQAAQLIAATLSLRIYTTLLLFAAVAALGWLTNPGDEGRLLVVLISVAMLPRALVMWCQTVFIASERSVYILRQDLIYRPLEVLVGVGALLLGADVLMLAAVHTVSWAGQAWSSFRLVRTKLPHFAPQWRILGWQAMLSDGFKIAISRVSSNWFLAGPIVLFRHLSTDLEALGLLAFCMQILNMLKIIPKAVSTAAMPLLARALSRGDGKQHQFLRIIGLLAAAQSLVLAGLATLVGAKLVTLAVGPAYAAASPYLIAISWMAVFPAMGAAVQKVLGIEGRLNWLLLCSLSGALLMTLLAWILTSSHGMAAMLTATLFGNLAWLLLLSRHLRSATWTYAGIALGSALAAGGTLLQITTANLSGNETGMLPYSLSAFLLFAASGWWLDRRADSHQLPP